MDGSIPHGKDILELLLKEASSLPHPHGVMRYTMVKEVCRFFWINGHTSTVSKVDFDTWWSEQVIDNNLN